MQACLGVVTVFLLAWLAEIVMANQIAQRDFHEKPCWFVQGDQPVKMPGLVAGPQGIYVPNLLRQLNRRFVGLGLDEPNLYGPHFAVATLDADGRPALWAWSYKKADFWPLSDKAQSRGGVLTDFVSEETLRTACPDLRPPTNARQLKG